MNINQTTKYDIGQTVYFVSHYTSREEIPCTHCGGNYREIVNNIEYKCPYCNGGRETRPRRATANGDDNLLRAPPRQYRRRILSR